MLYTCGSAQICIHSRWCSRSPPSGESVFKAAFVYLYFGAFKLSLNTLPISICQSPACVGVLNTSVGRRECKWIWSETHADSTESLSSQLLLKNYLNAADPSKQSFCNVLSKTNSVSYLKKALFYRFREHAH